MIIATARRKAPILVIDCHSILHTVRAVAKKQMLYNGGEDTSIIEGFFTYLYNLSLQFTTSDFIFCWDSPHSLRKEIFPGYKLRAPANAQTALEEAFDKEAFKQFHIIHETILPYLGYIHNHKYEGYEADDIIAATVTENENEMFIIISADADMYQLLDYARLYLHRKKELVTRESFREMYGINCHEWWRVKAIAGCTSDTVPGVVGVGEKTAIKYLTGGLKKHTKAYLNITSKEGLAITARNEPLVRLPFADCPIPDASVRDAGLSKQRFVTIATKYRLHKFLNPVTLREYVTRLHLQG